MLNNIVFYSFSLYVVALHSSMAGMEIFSSLLLFCAFIALVTRKVRFSTPFMWPALVFMGVILLNCLITPAVAPWTDRLEELRWIPLYIGLTKSLEIIWSDENEGKIIKAWIVALFVAMAYGVFQFFTGMDPIRGTTKHLVPAGNIVRATGFFSLCLTYAYSMGISGLSLTLPSQRIHRLLPFAALTFSGVAVLVSLTRGAWVAYGAALLVLAFMLRSRLSRTQMGLLFSLMLIPIVGLFFTDGGYDRIIKMINFQSDPAVNERFGLWKAYWQMFLDNPFFGVGYGQGHLFLTEYYQNLGMTQRFVSHAHNDYIQSLAETGLVGTLAFVFLLGFTLKKTFDLRKYKFEWASSLLAAQVYFIVGAGSQANFTDAEVNHALIFNWAIVSVLIIKNRQQGA